MAAPVNDHGDPGEGRAIGWLDAAAVFRNISALTSETIASINMEQPMQSAQHVTRNQEDV
jgi:hypothetical protein